MTALFWLVPGFLLASALLVAGLRLRPRHSAWLALASTVIAAVPVAWLGIRALTGHPLTAVFRATRLLPIELPVTFTFQADALTGLFLLLLAFLAPVLALYSVSYLERQDSDAVRRFYTAYLTLVAAIAVVITAADWILFLFAWESMTLTSYLLMLWHQGQERAVRASWTYLLTTGIASGGILIAAILLAVNSGGYLFSATPQAMRAIAAHSPGLLHLLLGLFLVAFATKAAVYPLSFWLPEAYGAAPAPAAALFSGLMAKMGVYGMVRVFLFLLPPGTGFAQPWGVVLTVLGVGSMLVGNIRSMGEQDARRLVAQSSIGQMGYMLLGLGVCLTLMVSAPGLATLGLVGALYHVVNHALFKPLLFLSTGAVERQVGHQDLRQMGGLIGSLPVAAGAALLGGLALAGIPPLNGFASKWLLYRAAVFGGMYQPWLMPAVVAALFLSTVSLAAALKYFSSAFLGAAPAATDDHAEPWPMAAAQIVLALACVMLGLWPGPVVLAALAVFDASQVGVANASAAQLMGAALGSDAYTPVALLLALALGVGLTLLVRRSGTGAVKADVPWLGGEQLSPTETRYDAGQLYLPLQAHFAPILRVRPWRSVQLPQWPLRLLALDDWLYAPVLRFLHGVSRQVSALHRGRIRAYLAWQFLALLLLLVGLLVAEGGVR